MSEKEAREIIETIKQEEFPYALAIAKAYDLLEQENEKLKHYQCKRNCASRLAENRKLTDTEILDRLQEWLKCELALSKASELYREKYESETYERCLEKILQLKEMKK